MPSANKAKIKLGHKLLAVAIAILAISFSAYRILNPVSSLPVVTINDRDINVAVVSSFADRQLGLSDYTTLPANEGMLFVFEDSSLHGFWMKDMDFSIDIAWLDAQRNIVHIEPSVSPNTFPEVFYPEVPARYVLEVNADFFSNNQISIGDSVEFSF